MEGIFHPWLRRCSAVLMTLWLTTVAVAELREEIDRHVEAKWQEEGVEPVPLADDATFLRRVYLDLCGVIPSHDEARAFLDDDNPLKRAKLIDRLLEDPRYARHQADVWDMLYFGRTPPGFGTDKRSGFQNWLREQFRENKPYDEIASAILKAEGNSAEDGAPMFFVQYRDHPADAMQSITQKFLGIQLQCARCHDHPYEAWSQRDFYGMTAFLARLEVVELGQKNDQKAFAIGEKRSGEIDFTGPASEAEPGKEGRPVAPKFLLAGKLDEPKPPQDLDEPRRFPNGKVPPKPSFSRKDALADWIADAENPYFTRAVANRVWAQFMGRGLVHPVDDMSESNPPTHPELLDELTKQLAVHDFDLKWYIRELANSRTYQLAATGAVEQQRPRWFERARTRPLSAEELAAAWRVATNYAAVDPETKEKLDKGERFYPLTSGYQLKAFGQPADGVGNFLGGLHEHLYLNNGGIDRLFSRNEGGLIHTLAENDAPWQQRVERLFLSVLSRPPSPEESQTFVEFLETDSDRSHNRLKEAAWVLMTCSEFRFNH